MSSRSTLLAIWLALSCADVHAASVPADSSDQQIGFEWAVQPLVSWSENQGVGAGAQVYLLGPPPASTRVEGMVFLAQHDFWSVQTAYRSYRFLGSSTTMRISAVLQDDGSERFFGVGNDSDGDDETGFQRATYAIAVEPGRRWAERWEARLRLQLSHDDLSFGSDPITIGGRLYRPGTSLRTIATLTLQHDRRDIEWAPRRGSLARVEIGRSLGPNVEYWRWALDLRAYRALTSSLVLAGRAEITGVEGDDLPFFVLPAYGGSTYGRGLSYGRFREASRRSAVGELRWDPLEFAGVVAFVDAGGVAPGLLESSPGGIHVGWGGGLRLRPGPRGLISRCDLGYGGADEGLHLYLNFSHAF